MNLQHENDYLSGARAIARHMQHLGFKDCDERRIYHLADTRGLPTFHWNGRICARRSAIAEHLQRLADMDGGSTQ